MTEHVLTLFIGVTVLVVPVGVIFWRYFRAFDREMDREWCSHYRHFGRQYRQLAQEIEEAGGEAGPWFAARIAEMDAGQARYCEVADD